MPLTILPNTNLFDVECSAFAHGCNTQGVMGSGIAVQFRSNYPNMYEAYKRHCVTQEDKDLIGDVFIWELPNGRYVFNLFTQIGYGRDGKQYADYKWVESACLTMFKFARSKRLKSIAMPLIGCGYGGLQWELVQGVIDNALKTSKFKGEVFVAVQ